MPPAPTAGVPPAPIPLGALPVGPGLVEATPLVSLPAVAAVFPVPASSALVQPARKRLDREERTEAARRLVLLVMGITVAVGDR